MSTRRIANVAEFSEKRHQRTWLYVRCYWYKRGRELRMDSPFPSSLRIYCDMKRGDRDQRGLCGRLLKPHTHTASHKNQVLIMSACYY